MKIGTTYHIAFAIPFIRRKAMNEWDELKPFVRPKNKKSFLSALDELEKKGYEVVPPCDNYGKDGTCQGHSK